MGRYYNHYYGKFRLYNKVCLVGKKIWHLQLRVSNICHVNNISRIRGCTITKRPIDLKLGLSIQSWVMHVRKERFFKNSNCKLELYAIYRYL